MGQLPCLTLQLVLLPHVLTRLLMLAMIKYYVPEVPYNWQDLPQLAAVQGAQRHLPFLGALHQA